MMPRFFTRRRLEHSFALSSAGLVVVLLATVTLVVHERLEEVLRRGLEARAASVAQSIGAVATPSLLAYNYPALQVAAAGAAGDPDIGYVVILDKEGRVAGIAGAHADAFGRAGSVGEPVGFQPGVRRVTGAHGDRDAEMLEVRVPVRVAGSSRPWGDVLVGMRYGLVRAELRRVGAALGLAGLLLCVLAVAASRFLARRITAPLRGLARATEALAHGDLDYRITVSGARELAELAHAFNVMMGRVQEKASESQAYQQELAQLNATLETQVRDRTLALEESERQYRGLVECSPEAILIVQEGRLRFVNPSFVHTFGIPAERAMSETFRLESLFEDGSAEAVRSRISAWTNGRSPGPVEVVARDAEGKPRTLELRGSPIDYRGNPAAECLLVDVTDAQQLRAQLEDSNRLRALGELASGVAHDFNNLLGTILGRAQLLRRRALSGEAERDLDVIEQAARDGRETVLRIQEFSRVRMDQPFSAVALADVLAGAAEITRSRWKSDAERRGVTIVLDVAVEPVPPILGNATELREVFTNLILNSVDAVAGGGRIRVVCARDGEVVRATVEDDGVGMPEATRRRLFDPFFSTKSVEGGVGGSGMGLAVAYGIVKRHGGSIEVTSSPGQGTCFALEFPVHVAEIVEHRVAPEAHTGACPARVLVIDDERPIAELLGETLAIDGHQVDTAIGGVRGLGLAATQRYDVALTDLGMPDMSGWDVTRELHRLQPDLPVILVTGWGTTIGRDEIARNGVAEIVHKPFEIKDLLETVARVLAARR